jgi:polyhydroxyalkanoate synthesis regulator phasin
MSKKKVIAVVITTLALTAGSIGVAGASSKGSHRVGVSKVETRVSGGIGNAPQQALATILKELVAKGTITQAQADSIVAAITAAQTAAKENRPVGPKGGPLKAERDAVEALISTTIGVDSATIKSRLKAGESLAVIAGAKKDALIAALVADHTKRIDAAVTAGSLTAAQATAMKANVVAHVTEMVNAVGGKHGEGKGGPGRGHGGHGPKGGATVPTLPAPASSTGA